MALQQFLTLMLDIGVSAPHYRYMRNRSSIKRNQDMKEVAAAIVHAAAIGEIEPLPLTADGKNAAAVALGRRGGKKGGPARAAVLSSKRRSEIAKKAANARWKKYLTG
jgi:hypothetical protein